MWRVYGVTTCSPLRGSNVNDRRGSATVNQARGEGHRRHRRCATIGSARRGVSKTATDLRDLTQDGATSGQRLDPRDLLRHVAVRPNNIIDVSADACFPGNLTANAQRRSIARKR
jgi:hypothetical protein